MPKTSNGWHRCQANRSEPLLSSFGKHGLHVLDALTTIDWNSLSHAYGNASDVPDLLKGLMSEEEEHRKQCIYELFGSIWHQGTVYPATAAAVPFLFELLTADEIRHKSDIACLLASIGSGCGYIEAHALYFQDEFRNALREEGKTLEEELSQEARVTASVRSKVSPGLKHLIPFLQDKDTDVRSAVAYALGLYPEHASSSLRALEQALSIESDGSVIQAIDEACSRLRGHKPA